MEKAQALLRVVMPDINLADPQFDVHATEQMLQAIKRENSIQIPSRPVSMLQQQSHHQLQLQKQLQPHQQQQEEQQQQQPPPPPPASDTGTDAGEESLLETMVENSGSLDLDDQGHWDYHGHSSGIIFLQRLRKQLGASDMATVLPRLRPVSQFLDSPKSTSESPQDSSLPPTHDLPPRVIAQKLCRNALDDACALMRFVHEPSFYAMVDRIYDIPPEQFTNEEHTFLPLLYLVIAVGCLFSDDGASTLDVSGYESATGQG